METKYLKIITENGSSIEGEVVGRGGAVERRLRLREEAEEGEADASDAMTCNLDSFSI